MLQLAHYTHKLAFEIDAADVWAALKNNEAIVLIDTRSITAYREEHIIGAINIPHRSMSSETTAHLDKNTLVVTYCDGIGCNASTKGALKMCELGFRVKELIGGMDWWKRDLLPTSTVAAQNKNSIECGC